MRRSKAIDHWERTGTIIPGHAGEIAAYRAAKDGDRR